MKYNAFISYSHASDSDLAPSIERALERFAKPTFKRRALNVFRDSNDLSASPDLWGKIQDGLAHSEYFIFFASTRAAGSKWCRKEVDFWKANKPFANFLVVLTEGELVWDDARNDFDWDATNCLPDNLSGVFESEPLYVDFRELPDKLTLDAPDFINKVVLLAATLHGRSVGDMVGEDARQHKRTLRIRNVAIGVLLTLLIGTVAAALFAFQQKGIAEREKDEALRQANRALARSYLSYAKANLTTNPTLSVRLAEYGYGFAKAKGLALEDFEDQLIASFYSDSNFYLSAAASDGDSRRAVHVSGRPTLIRDDEEGDEEDDEKAHEDHRPAIHASGGKALVREGDALYLAGARGERIGLDVPDGYTAELTSYSFSPRGRFVVTVNRMLQNAGQHFDELAVFDLHGQKLCEATSFTTFGEEFFYPPGIKFDSEETRFLVFGHYTGATLYESATDGAKPNVLHGGSRGVLDIDLTPDGGLAAFSSESGAVHVRRLGEDDVVDRWQLSGHGIEPVHAIAFSEDGRYLHTQSNSFGRRWRAENDARRKYVMLAHPPGYNAPKNVATVGNQGHMNFSEDRYSVESIHEYVDASDKRIAEFSEDESADSNTWSSADGRYYATRNGLFNGQGERLISFNETRYAYKNDFYVIGFSSDSKFFFMIDKLLFLDAETILSRLNDESLFGQIAQLEPRERELYAIGDP